VKLGWNSENGRAFSLFSRSGRGDPFCLKEGGLKKNQPREECRGAGNRTVSGVSFVKSVLA